MSIISTAANAYFTYKFLRILTTPWEKMEAYELGIIDENGNILKKTRQLSTAKERNAYTIFHRLAFNLKKILEKVPLGRTRLASYAAALFLLREQTDMTEEQLQSIFDKLELEIDPLELSESVYIQEDQSLMPGTYYLKEDIASSKTGELIALKGTKVQINEFAQPVGNVFGYNIYKVLHLDTKENVYITYENITR
jgi:hypothetical protein